MKDYQQNEIRPKPDAIEPALLAEALSAWMDGEALPCGVSQQELLQWMLHDDDAMRKWQLWHASTDCLHSLHFHEQMLVTQSDVGSLAWSERLQQRLSETIVEADPLTNSAGFQALLPQDKELSSARRAAVNDPVWPWKMAAGFASLVAMGAMIWNFAGSQLEIGGRSNAGVVMQSQNGASQAVFDIAQKQSASMPVLTGQNTVQQPINTAISSDAYTDALMLAHAQLGEYVLMQDALSTE